jgi:Uma2 family endonuclease
MPTLLQAPKHESRSTRSTYKTERSATNGSERLTVSAFRQMDFDDNDVFSYELLDGELVKKSAPTPFHQRISRAIAFAMHTFVVQNKLGEVLYAPVDVFLDDNNAVQPDVLFLANDRRELVTADGVQGAPNLVVEIVSPSSVQHDRGKKMKLYERHNVEEYWLVDERTRSVEVYAKTSNAADGFELREVCAETDESDENNKPPMLQSAVLSGFAMPIQAVFEGVRS